MNLIARPWRVRIFHAFHGPGLVSATRLAALPRKLGGNADSVTRLYNRAMDTITMLDTKTLQKRFSNVYHVIAGSLSVAAVASVVVNYITGLGRKSIFVPEMFAVLIFAVYWFVKSREFHHTAAEKKAAKGEIVKVKGKLYDATKPAQMEAAAERNLESTKQP